MTEEFLEGDRIYIHEAAHVLADFIFSGVAPTVTIRGDDGRCQGAWPSYLKLTDDDSGLALALAAAKAAGWVGEQLIYGTVDWPGSGPDFNEYHKCLDILADDTDLARLVAKRGLEPRGQTIQEVMKALLTRYRKSWLSVAAALPQGTTSGERLVSILTRYDDRMKLFEEQPLLRGDWRQNWRRLQTDVGMEYAFNWVDHTPVPLSRDHRYWSARHRYWSRVFGT